VKHLIFDSLVSWEEQHVPYPVSDSHGKWDVHIVKHLHGFPPLLRYEFSYFKMLKLEMACILTIL